MTQFIKQHATKAFELPKKQTEAEDAEEAAAIEKAAAEEAASALEVRALLCRLLSTCS